MKRLNPKTNEPFKSGEEGHPFKYRETKEVTRIFKSYQNAKNKHGFFNEVWVTQKQLDEHRAKSNETLYKKLETEEGHLKLYLSNSKHRAKKSNLNFDLDLDYIKSIQTDKCPIFGTPFVWGLSRRGNSSTAATIDRIVPELGYVKGNVVFISDLANRIKTDATEVELYAVANWLHEKRKEVLNAFKITTPSIPTGSDPAGKDNPELGTFSATGSWEDDDNPHHHCGTVHRQDLNYRTQASSGNSMGHGGEEVGTPVTLKGEQNNGYSSTENPWFTDQC